MQENRKIVELKPFSFSEELGENVKHVVCAYEIFLQQRTAGGIVFRLFVKNTTESTVSILSPLDHVKIDLQNSEGWPVLLRLHVPRSRIGPAANSEPDFPFDVTELVSSVDGRINEKIQLKIIELKPQEEFTYSLRISEVQPVKRNVTRQSNATQLLERGSYRLRIAVTIMSTEAYFKQYGSDFITVELI